MHLHFTSGYHPEVDSQTEHVNQMLEQYLRHYCCYQQDNWAQLLPLTEFTYNSTLSETTGVSPFYANKGYHLNIDIHPEHDLASLATHNYVVNLNELHAHLKENIATTQKHYQGPADQCRHPPPNLPIGSKVYVIAKFFRMTCPLKKLAE